MAEAADLESRMGLSETTQPVANLELLSGASISTRGSYRHETQKRPSKSMAISPTHHVHASAQLRTTLALLVATLGASCGDSGGNEMLSASADSWSEQAQRLVGNSQLAAAEDVMLARLRAGLGAREAWQDVVDFAKRLTDHEAEEALPTAEALLVAADGAITFLPLGDIEECRNLLDDGFEMVMAAGPNIEPVLGRSPLENLANRITQLGPWLPKLDQRIWDLRVSELRREWESIALRVELEDSKSLEAVSQIASMLEELEQATAEHRYGELASEVGSWVESLDQYVEDVKHIGTTPMTEAATLRHQRLRSTAKSLVETGTNLGQRIQFAVELRVRSAAADQAGVLEGLERLMRYRVASETSFALRALLALEKEPLSKLSAQERLEWLLPHVDARTLPYASRQVEAYWAEHIGDVERPARVELLRARAVAGVDSF